MAGASKGALIPTHRTSSRSCDKKRFFFGVILSNGEVSQDKSTRFFAIAQNDKSKGRSE
jgi:hypothetical protein